MVSTYKTHHLNYIVCTYVCLYSKSSKCVIKLLSSRLFSSLHHFQGLVAPSSSAGLESSIFTGRDLTTVIRITSDTPESNFLSSTLWARSHTTESSYFSPTVAPSASSVKYGASSTLPASLSDSSDTINIESSSPLMSTPSISSSPKASQIYDSRKHANPV